MKKEKGLCTKFTGLFLVLMMMASILVACGSGGEGNIPAETTIAHTQAMIWSDGQVGIVLDQVERVDALPWDASYRKPKAGCDYVAISLTIASKEVAHMGYHTFGTQQTEAIFSKLTDDSGTEYKEIAFTAQGIQFGNTGAGQLTGSYEFIQGTTIIIVFELPKSAEPKRLEFNYPFSNSNSSSWFEESVSGTGQIVIDL